jgi:O-antigen/teichoic acid export membrane protein
LSATVQENSLGWRGLLQFGGASLAVQVVQMACGLAVLRWLPPAQMGIWLTLQVVEAYALWIRLGVLNAMNREYPFLLAQGKNSEAVAHVQAAGAYMAACALAVTAGFGAAALVWAERGPDWQWALAAYALHAGGGVWRSFLEGTFRGGQDFQKLARVQLIGAALQVVTLPLVAFAGFRGFCGRAIGLAVALTIICHAARPVRAAWRWNRAILARLLVDGLPLFAANYLGAISAQFPRVLLAAAGGTALLGLYAPAAAVLALGALLPGTLLTYVLPGQNHAYGRARDPQAVVATAWRQAWRVSAVLLPLALLGGWALPSIVRSWFPGYAAGAHVLGWAAAAAALAPLRLATSVFSTLRAWRPMLAHALIGLLLAWLAPWLWLRAAGGDPLLAVVQGSLLAGAIHALAAWPCVRWAVRSAAA